MSSLPLLLIPGSCNDAAVWSPVRSLLERSGRAVTVCEVPGIPSIAGLAEHILATAPEKFDLAGVSLGGYVALELLATAPERIHRVVLVSSRPGPDSPAQRAARDALLARLPGEFEAHVSEIVELCLDEPEANRSEAGAAVAAELATMIRRVGVQTMIAHVVAARDRPDQSLMLRSAGSPVLLLHGTRDRVVPYASWDGWDQLPRRIVDSASHVLPLERAREVARGIEDWLDEGVTDGSAN